MFIHPTANINPETGIAFGYVAANDLDQDLVIQLLDGGKNETLAEAEYEVAIELLKENLLESQDVELPSPGEGAMDKLYELLEEYQLTFEFEQRMEYLDLQEPHIHGECEGIKYSTSWLGGALNFFILESPIITKTACKSSICVPNAGILRHPEEYYEGEVESYGIPEYWWVGYRWEVGQPMKQQPRK